MSLMTPAMPRGTRDRAEAGRGAPEFSYLAIAKRFVKSVAMACGFVAVVIAVMAIKYVAFFPRFVH